MLTTREQRFALAYIGEAAGNGQKAAEIAGYAKGSAKVTASRLLKKPHIKDAIANFAAKAANPADSEANRAKIADAAERRQILTKIARAGRNKKFAMPAIKALDVLNKMDGIYVQKHKHQFDGPVQVTLGEADARI
jgi:phage terminase small subunit